MADELVHYQTGLPEHAGVYACRIPIVPPAIWEDRFMFFDGADWWYISSDARYRGEVEYWIGPLQRRMT